MHLDIHMLAPPHTGINNTARVYPWLSPSTRPWSILPTRAAGAALTCDYSRPPPTRHHTPHISHRAPSTDQHRNDTLVTTELTVPR